MKIRAATSAPKAKTTLGRKRNWKKGSRKEGSATQLRIYMQCCVRYKRQTSVLHHHICDEGKGRAIDWGKEEMKERKKDVKERKRTVSF